MSKLRIGVVGAGEMMQSRHVDYLNSALLGTEVTWVCDREPRVGESLARRLGVGCETYVTIEKVPLGRVDAVVVAASGDHAPLIEGLLRRRCLPVFSEKPISTSIRSAQRLEAHLGALTDKIFVGYNRLFAPAFTSLRSLIQGDSSGSHSLTLRCVLPDDLLYRDQFHVCRSAPEPSMAERLSSDKWFEEVLLNLAIHELSILRAIDSKAKLETALRLPAGLIATFESDVAGTVVLHLECLRGPGGGYHESIEFNSNERRALVTYPSVYLRDRGARLETSTFSISGEEQTVRVDRTDPLELEWRAFLGFVGGADAGDNGFAGALEDLRMATAIANLCESSGPGTAIHERKQHV